MDRAAHLTDEELAELALSTAPATDPDLSRRRIHLAGCTACQEALHGTGRALAALSAPVEIHSPPPGVWDRIAADLELPRQADVELPRADAEEPAPTPIVDLTQRRRAADATRSRRRGVLPAVAAACLVIGIALGGVTARLLGTDSPGGEPAPGTVAVGDARLEPVTGDEFSGQAEMVQHTDGTMELIVEVTATPDPADGYLEVWLRDEDASRLISLGTVTSTTTRLSVPEGIDLDQYPVVDVSHEHFDGDPTHSGITLAAGSIRPATG